MIYLFHGSDTEKVREKAFAWVAAARAKEPGLAYARLAKEELTASTLEDAAQSGGLFIKRLLILLDDPFAKAKAKSEEEGDDEEESKDLLDEHLDALAASDNAIVILAPKLLAAKAKKIAAKAAKEYSFDAPKALARGFNGNLANALAARDGEKLWLEVERALRAGDPPEMLHGLLHWKARDILTKGGRAWPGADARKLSMRLISLLQETRRTGSDLATELERFALSI
jgi:DNA polymerase III delta subunit